jgi:leucyl aminopeptidase (aminopeptidase T)
MRAVLYWEQFAEIVVTRLARVKEGEPFLIVTNANSDLNLAQACLAAGMRAGADCQLVVKPRLRPGSASQLGPILSHAIPASKIILDLSDELDADPVTFEARKKGTRLLATNVRGIEDYVVCALLDVNQEGMVHNAERVAQLWDQTKHCHVTSPQGTDVSFELMPRKSVIGDGALTEDGEVDFFPGAQVTIAPVEETINGTIVIDGSDSIRGIVQNPYSFTMKDGIITAVEGGKEANVMREWLESRNDEKIYRLCHFSLGLNPQAHISGNFVEDERVLAAVDFGFGYQNPDYGGTIGLGPYHVDILLATPTIYLDGKEMSGGGKLSPEFGFEEL